MDMSVNQSETGRSNAHLLTIAQRLLKRWYVLFVVGVLGGIVGIAISGLYPAQYEAKASLLVAVDWGRSITTQDLTIYQSVDRVRALILADETLEKARNQMSSNQKLPEYVPSLEELRTKVRVSQTTSGFDVYVYADDPVFAADLANTWAEVSLEMFEEAILHAIRASELQKALYESYCSLRSLGEGDDQIVVWQCQSSNVEPDPESLPETMLDEISKSKGIPPFLTFAWLQKAVISNHPILWNRGFQIIAGVLIGLLGSAMLIAAGDLRKLWT
jgi:capsular polysaccharide biosynthesis protein